MEKDEMRKIPLGLIYPSCSSIWTTFTKGRTLALCSSIFKPDREWSIRDRGDTDRRECCMKRGIPSASPPPAKRRKKRYENG